MKPIALLTLLSLAACGPKEPPPELIGARNAYANAEQMPVTQQYDPAALHEAKVALDAAEQAFVDEGPKDYTTLDLSYVAHRKSQIAVAKATIASEEAKAAAAQQQALAAALAAREEADRRAEEALKELAAVKRDQRGLVLTLSGSVLFKSNSASLLPEAQGRLDQVAQALKESKGSALVIEGHTDNQGSDTFNQGLSEKRAQAVKDYLVKAGYDSSLIQVSGMGEANPVADNASAEGRANNRRVEIIVKQPTEEQKQ
jgi:outer membrane protein OmpA-like peptidoglycan-associated protein/predicted small lipoprotein YifL